MIKLNTIIIDDDSTWQFILGKYVKLHPSLELVATCGSAMEGFGKMTESEIDLIICDIEMPEMSGLNFIKSIKNPPLVIFVTSHPAFALDCYEVSPVDFLLKPLDMERFLKAVEKARARFSQSPSLDNSKIDPYFFVRENSSYLQIFYKDVLYMKSQENYLKIVTANETFLPILPITKIEEHLKGDVFLRVHRSFIVNRGYIRAVHKNDIELKNGEMISIGDQYRSQITKRHIEENLVSRVL